jgi:hypothetical protein
MKCPDPYWSPPGTVGNSRGSEIPGVASSLDSSGEEVYRPSKARGCDRQWQGGMLQDSA